VPELTGLTSQDIRILDTIIERAAPSSTTFLSVFKAYNDVLQEHGLDPHEVVYYGKLLKLGTLRGKNWGEKWKAVKLQHGYGDSSENADDLTATPKMAIPLPSTRTPPQHNIYPNVPPRETDSLTLHSHQDDTDIGQSVIDDDTEQFSTQPHRAPWPISRPPQPATSSVDSGLDSDTRNYTPRLFSRQSRPMSLPPRGVPTFNSGTSDGNADAPSTTPPSYRAAVRDTSRQPASHLLSRHRSKSEYPLSRVAPSTSHQPVAQARKRSGSVVNENEAWRKIQMVRDEKEADKFRDDLIVERCWDLWKRGFQWIHVSTMPINNPQTTACCVFRQRTSKLGWHEIYISSDWPFSAGER
jgi:protein SFI1